MMQKSSHQVNCHSHMELDLLKLTYFPKTFQEKLLLLFAEYIPGPPCNLDLQDFSLTKVPTE